MVAERLARRRTFEHDEIFSACLMHPMDHVGALECRWVHSDPIGYCHRRVATPLECEAHRRPAPLVRQSDRARRAVWECHRRVLSVCCDTNSASKAAVHCSPRFSHSSAKDWSRSRARHWRSNYRRRKDDETLPGSPHPLARDLGVTNRW